ncbi:coiled-coil domain-containing protein 106-like isoform X3 [Astyanax mexicanus]|uniref:Coiled-coil domain-containing protein 106-like isoform X1 n=3 Tax=Astyanax mexicanus TaxID=7994 RepID=A0A8T2LR55_ASTMX|nr:coiled-coil domain-containing protein 106 isoform X3 [Astyanax mexicanus]XP_049327881.1 coiled-coil domain-containing protein 106-like isoform X3 [Astyanax mexicanus]XP_049330098.1 coiled-coil domain-containing protein 106-like isoform X1 [Astyanax mexicanus]XP_049336631.1 coiled-coil domain-containing protein 106-like isoform X3 [Astyanax mexicanus]KAG9274363.1 coiled-coil domain-containing protein 106-like isoform X1 [Astyanax mexicanus]KAG9277800.1 coiled-coil domain-containing protein 1
MDTRGRKKAVSNETSEANVLPPQQSKAVSPTVLQDLQIMKMHLETEKEKNKCLQETIKHLQSDKEFLKEQLSRMTGRPSSSPSVSSVSGSSTATPKVKGKKAIGTEEESSGEIAVLSTESSTIDESSDEEMKPFSKGKKPRSAKQDDLSRTRAKTVRGVILRYKRALQAFNQGGSMKKAFQKVGVDRNTISRSSPIAELALAAPGVFQALPPWNAQVEKLSTFVDRCREATTDEIKEKIMQMKSCGELLPMSN